jgi:hypothetical protein
MQPARDHFRLPLDKIICGQPHGVVVAKKGSELFENLSPLIDSLGSRFVLGSPPSNQVLEQNRFS